MTGRTLFLATVAWLATIPGLRAADFFLTDFATAEARAKATGKPIFLDAFTTWCAPCKRMDAEVFSRPEVRALLEKDFVPLRLDMEQPAAQALRDRFRIGVFPTLLVFDARGEWHRATGYLDPAELSAFAKTSLDASGNYRAWRERYTDGERDTVLLRDLAAYAKTASLSERDAFEYAYLKATGDWSSPAASLRLLEGPQSLATPLYDSLVARQDQVAALYGAPLVDERIARLLDEALFGALPAKPRAARRLIARTYPTAVDSTFLRYRMRRAREAGDAKAFGRYAIKSQRDFPTSDPEELAELIYVFAERLPGWKEEEVEFWRKRELTLRGE